MLYTVAKLAALLSGVAMAADHSVPHSDETEHMEDESEPQSFTALLCPDVTGVIISLCDSTDWLNLKLLDRHMYRSINALIFGKWQSEIEKMIGDQSTMDGIEEGILDCDSITQVRDLVDFCETKRVCFTPRFCGKLIQFHQIPDRDHTKSKPTLELPEFPSVRIDKRFQFYGNPHSFANDHLIGKWDNQPALLNTLTGKVTELPPCKEARFVSDRIIALFHGDKFQIYDLFNGEGAFFAEGNFSKLKYGFHWSLIQTESGWRAIFCKELEVKIACFIFDNDLNRWVKKRIKYEKSKDSEICFKHFLSPDGSILIAQEKFEGKGSLINIIDTHTETIRHTVMLPYDDYIETAQVSRNGAYLEFQRCRGVLMDLSTGRWIRLRNPHFIEHFYWMSDSRFWVVNQGQIGEVYAHIRSLDEPCRDLVKLDSYGYPLDSDSVLCDDGRIRTLTDPNKIECVRQNQSQSQHFFNPGVIHLNGRTLHLYKKDAVP